MAMLFEPVMVYSNGECRMEIETEMIGGCETTDKSSIRLDGQGQGQG